MNGRRESKCPARQTYLGAAAYNHYLDTLARVDEKKPAILSTKKVRSRRSFSLDFVTGNPFLSGVRAEFFRGIELLTGDRKSHGTPWQFSNREGKR